MFREGVSFERAQTTTSVITVVMSQRFGRGLKAVLAAEEGNSEAKRIFEREVGPSPTARSLGSLRSSAFRRYAPGATPIQRLNALENAASASYPTRFAISATPKQAARLLHSPARQVRQRRLFDELREPRGKRGARHSDLRRQRLDRPVAALRQEYD